MSFDWEFVLVRSSEWTPEQVRGWLAHTGRDAKLATCGGGAHPVLWDVRGSDLAAARATLEAILPTELFRELVNSFSASCVGAAEALSLRGQALVCCIAQTSCVDALILFEGGEPVRFVLQNTGDVLWDGGIVEWERGADLRRTPAGSKEAIDLVSELLRTFASEGEDFHPESISDDASEAVHYEAEPWTPTGRTIPGEATRWSAPARRAGSVS